MSTNQPKSKPLIAIIGSLNIDFVTTTPRCPQAGETLTATSLAISAGGKGANQAVGCGKASFTSPSTQDVAVEMIGAVGANDVYVEKLLLPTLREAGVGVEGVRAMKYAQTGTASIIVETAGGKGENRILVVGGANHEGMGDVEEVIGRVAKVASDKEPDVVVMQGEIPRKTVLGLLKHFNTKGSKTKVVFNPAPVFEDGIPLDALTGLEVLVINETETILLGNALKSDGFIAGATTEEDLQRDIVVHGYAKQFHNTAKVKTVLITLGSRGVFFSTTHGDQKGFVPGVKVPKVVDTTAAGDTFVGYFATSLARHVAGGKADGEFDVRGAVERANAAAAKCVQREGAMVSIPFGYE